MKKKGGFLVLFFVLKERKKKEEEKEILRSVFLVDPVLNARTESQLKLENFNFDSSLSDNGERGREKKQTNSVYIRFLCVVLVVTSF